MMSKIVFGGAPLGLIDMGNVDLKEVMAAAAEAFDSGITTFDCADVYGLGEGEKNLARALGHRLNDAHIISKFGVAWKNSAGTSRAETYRDCSPSYMRKALDASLTRLRRDYIDTYLVHWPDGKTPIEDILDALESVRKQGKIINFGLSNFNSSEIVRVNRTHEFQCPWFQAECNILMPDSEIRDLELIRNTGTKVMAYGPLAQGFLTGKYVTEPKFPSSDRRSRMKHFSQQYIGANRRLILMMDAAAKKAGVSIREAAIAWCFGTNVIDVVVIGMKTRAHVRDSQGILDMSLNSDLISELRTIRENDLTPINRSVPTH
jgi:aryl-alcohol dehydrogenase-like predicted oxidoreductase